MAQAELVTDEAVYWSFINIMFGLIHWLPSSLSDDLQEVVVTGDQMKCNITLTKLWICLGLNIKRNIWDYVNTKLNKDI